ncbi:ferredoxin [Novosphingobium barchaimii]|nr:ferredoxin [Novosphingobium barchaimii]
MSLANMIARHPDVASEDFNETLATAARHAVLCEAICSSCADACVAEQMDIRQCVRKCLDCAEVCHATGRMALRRTGENVEALRLMLETCARVCGLCADECVRHDASHCKLCAEMCRECAADCSRAIPTVQ